MNKEFIPYEQALELKELGFSNSYAPNNYELCIGQYHGNELSFPLPCATNKMLDMGDKSCVAPLYQQAFRWFREKYYIYHIIIYRPHKDEFDAELIGKGLTNFSEDIIFKTYEEAELACLKKLIEIVKNK